MRADRRWVDEDSMFATPTGQSLDVSNLRRRFNAALRAAGLPHQRFHDLRHECATLRLEQGEELAVVSRMLGHASLSTTANTYMHTTDAMLGRAAERDRRHPRPEERIGLVWVQVWVRPRNRKALGAIRGPDSCLERWWS